MPQMQVRHSYLNLVKRWEGCPLFSYDDAKYPPRPAKVGDRISGTLTIFAGHTGTDVYVGQVGTDADADAALLQDLAHAEANVMRVVKVPLTPGEFEALTDFDFNAGDGALNGSTLLKKLNAGDYAAVPAELMKWDHTRINGILVESPGLKTRCTNRVALWLDGATTYNTNTTQGQVAEKAPTKATATTGAVTVGGPAVVVGAAASAVASGAPWGYVLAIVAVVAAVAGIILFVRAHK